MANSLLVDSINELKIVSQTNPDVLVSFSGGKDSWVCLDLATRIFKRVVGLFMYFVPGLEMVEEQLDRAQQKYGIEIRQYPHWIVAAYIKGGIYTLPTLDNQVTMPHIQLADIHAMARDETGINHVIVGTKLADGMFRRYFLDSTSSKGSQYKHCLFPLKKWSKFDVLAYMEAQKIPVPKQSQAGISSGIDLTTPTLLWLYDNYPEDFARICQAFPFAMAGVYRREWYGIEA